MKRLTPLLLLLATPLLLAEEVTLKQSAILKSGRTLVSLKPGAVVELVSREGSEITIKYKDLTGKIPADKLEESKEPDSPPAKSAAPVAKSKKAKPPPKKPAEKKPPAEKTAENRPANPPQTGYGKAVQKARENAAAHDKNLVRPTNEVLKDQ
ncbi:MAG: hypothetical protein ACREH8_23420 [Opitutaceae bacterium]